MQRSRTLAFLAAAALAAIPLTFDRSAPAAIGLATAQAAVDVNLNLFFTSLEPHGAWIPSAEYNYIWVPTGVDKDWAPYTNGHWVYTDRYGWYFVSDEPFASIVYHYGRWGYDPLIGWFWVPGFKFAGAYVVWRKSDTVVAWAPLPPQGRGYATSLTVSINIGSVPQHYWRVVPVNQFLAPQLRVVVFAGDVRTDLFRTTQPAGTVIIQNNVVVNNVININFIEQKTSQKVEVAKVETVSDPQSTSASSTAVKAFVADIPAPDKTAAPSKVTTTAEVQAPTKGQSTAALGAPPKPTDTAKPATASANPRCADAAFAKSNAKDCATTGNAAATTTATVTPSGNAAGTAGTTPTPSGTTTGTAGANANAAATAPTATGDKPKATGNATADTTATGNATIGTPDRRCANAAFAKANAKTCATASVGATTNAGANANVKPQANVATPNATAPTASPSAATGGNADVKPQANVTPPNATAPTANPSATAGGNAKATATATAGGNERCADATFAKNNPKVCVTGNATTGGANAAATGSGNAGGAAKATAQAPANAQGATAGGNVSVQGNAQGNPKCSDATFAKNNPKVCTVAKGNAAASAGASGSAAPAPASAY